MSTIHDLATQIGQLLSEITEIKKVYTHPVEFIPATLPSVVSAFEKLSTTPETNEGQDITYYFKARLYTSATNAKIDVTWERVEDYTELVLKKLGANPSLMECVYYFALTNANTFIATKDNTNQSVFGVEFDLVVKKEEYYGEYE